MPCENSTCARSRMYSSICCQFPSSFWIFLQEAQIARVFVGRLELVRPPTENAVEAAFASHDNATLERYGRFLEPILQTMTSKDSAHPRAQKLNAYLNAVYAVQTEQLRGQH